MVGQFRVLVGYGMNWMVSLATRFIGLDTEQLILAIGSYDIS